MASNHDDVIRKRYPHYWPFVGESTGDRWIPSQGASNGELPCFPCPFTHSFRCTVVWPPVVATSRDTAPVADMCFNSCSSEAIVCNLEWQIGDYISWWRHQMKTFSALLAICAGNSPFTGEFSAQGSVTRSFDVFFDLRLNKRLNKQWWGWWFETPSCPLWRYCIDKVFPISCRAQLSVDITRSCYFPNHFSTRPTDCPFGWRLVFSWGEFEFRFG